jgi:uncharacterized protein (DUF305 family)
VSDDADTQLPPVQPEDAGTAGGRRSPLTTILVIVILIAAMTGAGAVGWIIGNRSADTVAADSVDVGFVRDMSTHHTQAIVMAERAWLYSDNASVKLIARDIYMGQTFQVGQMAGWLDTWGLTRSSTITAMAWMGGHQLAANGLMPGMATTEEMSKLQTLTGTALDTDFLQLMIRHHQGGLPMAQYAATHASKPFVRALANTMLQSQSSEIIALEQLLRQLGGTPLPAPS